MTSQKELFGGLMDLDAFLKYAVAFDPKNVKTILATFALNEETLKILASGRTQAVDLSFIREKVLKMEETDRASVFTLILWYNLSGPKKPNVSDKRIQSILLNGETLMAIRYKGTSVITKETVTPARLISSLPEVAMVFQMKIGKNFQIIKTLPSALYPFCFNQVASIFDSDTDWYFITYNLWAMAKVTGVLSRKPNAGDDYLISVMRDQKQYQDYSITGGLIASDVKTALLNKHAETWTTLIAVDREFQDFLVRNAFVIDQFIPGRPAE